MNATSKNLTQRPARVRLFVLVAVILVVAGLAFWLWPSRSDEPEETPATAVLPDFDTSQMEPRVAELIGHARQRVEQEPESAEAWGFLGGVLEVHDLAWADGPYAEAQRLAPDDFRWPYFRAGLAASGGDFKQVLPLYEEAIRLAPEYAPLRCAMGNYLFVKPTAAVEAYREALRIDPDFAMAHRGLGQSLLLTGDAAAAIEPLKRAAELMPDDSVTQTALAHAYQRTGDTERAAAAAERAAALQPVHGVPDPVRDQVRSLGISSAICSQRVAEYMRHRHYAEALPDLLVMAEADPDDANTHYGLGLAYWARGDADRAVEHLRRAVAINPELVVAHVELARRSAARRDFATAETHYRQAIAVAPDHADAHAGLARLRLGEGRVADALAHFERAAAEPDADLYTDWAAALDLSGDIEAAREHYEQAIEIDSSASRAHLGLALLNLRGGDLVAAMMHLQTAILIDPNFADAHLYLGLAFQQAGRIADAIGRYRCVLQLRPNHPVRQALAQLEQEAAEMAARDPADPRLRPSPARGDFLRIAGRLYSSDQMYLGHEQARALRLRVDDPELTVAGRVFELCKLTRELIEIGAVDEAVASIERAFALLETAGRAPNAAQQRLRALVYLRKAEVQNCIVRHNADCCIFPLKGGGVHTERGPAEEAWKSYEAYLRARPGDLTGRWLLNVVAMALGRYPDGVPADERIPPESFASEYDVGRFRDVAPQLGLDAFNLCGGAIVDDFDGDGLLDIVTSTYDPKGPLTFYRNTGDGRFEDASQRSGAADQLGGLNCVGADYDNDGDLDVLILRGAWMFDDGRIRNSLLRNNGDGTFTDVTWLAGIALPAYPTQAAAWADFDNDGDLDLYIGNESRAESEIGTGDFPSQLFVNNADGTFSERAAAAGVTNDRYCKGVTAGDYDNDGDTDLYVSNSGANRLYRNNGDMTFTDIADQAGVIEPAGRSFATWFFDYDNDGRLDLFVGAFDATVADVAADHLGLPPNGSPPRLYRNNGDGTFADVTRTVGLDHMYLPMGANFGDLDNDGWLDIYLTTGDPSFETLMPNVMLRNDGGRRFQNVTQSGGFGHLQKGHGVAFADLDNDGDQDVYHQLGGFYPGDRFNNALFLNPGHGNHYLFVRLVGTQSNRSGSGVRIRVTLQTPNGPRTVHRAVGAVSSFGGSPRRQEIGLGDATRVERVEIDWPASRARSVLHDVPIDACIRVTEGAEGFELESLSRIALQVD